jgi:hypothetical protein
MHICKQSELTKCFGKSGLCLTIPQEKNDLVMLRVFETTALLSFLFSWALTTLSPSCMSFLIPAKQTKGQKGSKLKRGNTHLGSHPLENLCVTSMYDTKSIATPLCKQDPVCYVNVRH